MAKRGRPPILQNQAIIDQIIKNIESGLFVETSAALAGIGKTTFYSWLKTAKTARKKVDKKEKITTLEEQMIVFADRVMVAQATAEQSLLLGIDAAIDWRARAWRLEHLFPEKYTERKIVDTTVNGEVTETHKFTDKQMKDLGDAIVELSRTPPGS